MTECGRLTCDKCREWNEDTKAKTCDYDEGNGKDQKRQQVEKSSGLGLEKSCVDEKL